MYFLSVNLAHHQEKTRELPGKGRLCKEQWAVDTGEEDHIPLR